MALHRFLSLEKKLDKQPELKEQYSQFIREYEQLGHMKEITEDPNEDPGSVFYLPHHCVLRPSSTSTKLRVVFDESAKTSTGVSINDVLMTGPTIQNDLTAILLRFRGFQYVDIPKMFRQVGWRNNRNECITVRELLTVTYGLGPSPFQATMVLKQAAIDHQEEFPMAAEVVDKGTYMDDILTGTDTLAEACQLQREVSGLLAKACFGAHKWCANHPSIVQGIAEELRGNSFEVTNDSTKTIVKTLGVTWNPFEDWFSVSVPDFDDVEEITRRKLLSQLAKIFDPLGFFGPVLTYAKLILREVGELQIEWDDPVPKDVSEKWRSFRLEMSCLREVKLPRWISWKGALRLELHGYADASDLAYGACLYVRSIFSDEQTEMRLICSKSRILPKKRKPNEKAITTPRAELLAALLLAKLVEKFLNATELQFVSVHLWSDSKIVLAWLKKLPQQLQTYVSNRTSEIQNLTKTFHWHYVATDENPADLISRGVTPKKLMNSKKWWRVQLLTLLTEAVNLQLVSDLTTDAFLASLRRFVSRRGCPKTIHSDNATNFAGAKTELHELWKMFQNEYATKEITNYCVNKGIEWSFIPPQSPHFGGIWEAGVKQVKHLLRRIVGDRRLSYEELYTTLTQIEAVLNSRPLVPSSDDPSDYTAITPAHFLIGREMQAIPEPDYSHLKEIRLSRWQLVQALSQHFWKRWIAEYLPELQNRSKWRKMKKIKEGALVLLVDQNAPPLRWPLGRIIAAHPGDDGVTRVVTVRMANGAEFKRAVIQLCLLPLDEDED